MIRVGASGVSYKDRIGPHSSPELNERDWLAFYARELSTCELNFCYRLSNIQTLARMAQAAAGLFLFVLKALRGLQ